MRKYGISCGHKAKVERIEEREKKEKNNRWWRMPNVAASANARGG